MAINSKRSPQRSIVQTQLGVVVHAFSVKTRRLAFKAPFVRRPSPV